MSIILYHTKRIVWKHSRLSDSKNKRKRHIHYEQLYYSYICNKIKHGSGISRTVLESKPYGQTLTKLCQKLLSKNPLSKILPSDYIIVISVKYYLYLTKRNPEK